MQTLNSCLNKSSHNRLPLLAVGITYLVWSTKCFTFCCLAGGKHSSTFIILRNHKYNCNMFLWIFFGSEWMMDHPRQKNLCPGSVHQRKLILKTRIIKIPYRWQTLPTATGSLPVSPGRMCWQKSCSMSLSCIKQIRTLLCVFVTGMCMRRQVAQKSICQPFIHKEFVNSTHEN